MPEPEIDPYTFSEPTGPKNPHPLLALVLMWLFFFSAVLAALWIWS